MNKITLGEVTDWTLNEGVFKVGQTLTILSPTGDYKIVPTKKYNSQEELRELLQKIITELNLTITDGYI